MSNPIRSVHSPLSRSLRVRLTGATVLRDGALQRRSVALEDGRISKGPLPEIDMTGFLVLPGIVDLHSERLWQYGGDGDATIRPLAPAARPAAVEREAASNGLTTAWLAQRWSWEGGSAAPEEAQRMLAAHAAYGPGRAVIDLRMALACETHTAASRDALLAAVRRYRINLVFFTDRLGRLASRAGAAALPRASDLHRRMRRAAEERREVPRHLCRLAEGFDTLGVTYGSLDDADGEAREGWSMIGAKLCARPLRRNAAALARAVGDPVALGAPQVLGDAGPARGMVRDGLCSALVSDGVYPAMAEAAFALVEAGILPLPEAWGLISSGPAAILRLPDRGVIDYGRRADLTLVNARTRAVEGTISAGRVAHLAGEAAARFLPSRHPVPHLAAAE